MTYPYETAWSLLGALVFTVTLGWWCIPASILFGLAMGVYGAEMRARHGR